MTDEQKKTPVETLRESNLQAKIWENEHDKGVNFKTTFSRSYQDQEGQRQQASSFGEKDLLPLSNLASRSHDAVRDLREQERERQRSAEQETERQTTRARARDPDRGR